jgi:hypothetical protein
MLPQEIPGRKSVDVHIQLSNSQKRDPVNLIKADLESSARSAPTRFKNLVADNLKLIVC